MRLVVDVRQDYYLVYGILPNKCQERFRDRASRFVNAVNFGLIVGNFEFDFSDGEVRFKTYVNCSSFDSVPESIIEESIIEPCFTVDKYGNGFLRMFTDEDADVLATVAECEDKRMK